tara:strand:+ start:3717 stop:5060 length:1344 start_codon:yes stop_codon:yes gene_type:complete
MQIGLTQFNVDSSMNVNPTFESLDGLEVDIGPYHFETFLHWPSSDNKGWHNVFKFKGDGIDLNDDFEDDLSYYTEPSEWLKKDDGTYLNIMEDGFTTSNDTANALAGFDSDSISKDYLRHIANEILGAYTRDSKLGIVDIFNNEEDLLQDISNIGGILRNKHVNILNISRGDNNGVLNVDSCGNALENKIRDSTNIPHVILTKMLNTGGLARVTSDIVANSSDITNNVSIGQEKTEILKPDDTICFVLTINPSNSSHIVLGNNPINTIKYKVSIVMQTAYESLVLNARTTFFGLSNNVAAQYLYYHGLSQEIKDDIFTYADLDPLTTTEQDQLIPFNKVKYGVEYLRGLYDAVVLPSPNPDGTYSGTFSIFDDIDSDSNGVPDVEETIETTLLGPSVLDIQNNFVYQESQDKLDAIHTSALFYQWEIDDFQHMKSILDSALSLDSNS